MGPLMGLDQAMFQRNCHRQDRLLDTRQTSQQVRQGASKNAVAEEVTTGTPSYAFGR